MNGVGNWMVPEPTDDDDVMQLVYGILWKLHKIIEILRYFAVNDADADVMQNN